jgi:hypothetical protein
MKGAIFIMVLLVTPLAKKKTTNKNISQPGKSSPCLHIQRGTDLRLTKTDNLHLDLNQPLETQLCFVNPTKHFRMKTHTT